MPKRIGHQEEVNGEHLPTLPPGWSRDSAAFFARTECQGGSVLAYLATNSPQDTELEAQGAVPANHVMRPFR